MEKTIHFYEYEPDISVSHSWRNTECRLRAAEDIINTTQMGFLTTKLFDLGYRVFVHESDKKFYEIVLGDKNERTNREIKRGHNLFKMWQSGEFI